MIKNKLLQVVTFMLALLFVSTSVLSAQNNSVGGGGGLSLMSCDSDAEKCFCYTISECNAMEKRCDDPGKITCKENTSNCECKWKSKIIKNFVKPELKTKNNFLLKN